MTPGTPPINPLPATAISRDAAYIASQARSNAANPAQAPAVRVSRLGLSNLNLSAAPFPTLAPSTAAQAMSDDGAILYGTAGNPTRAMRFDVTTSSSLQSVVGVDGVLGPAGRKSDPAQCLATRRRD